MPNTELTQEPCPKPNIGKAKLSEGWTAFVLLWNEYTWVTRGATLILIVVSFLSITKELDCVTKPFCISIAWMTALTSDGMFSLWALIIALCVGIHLKMRQEKGLLDGTQHYNIARALAYGYFSNFLVGALLHIRKRSEALKLAPNNRLKLRVVFPSTLQELDQFRKTLEHEFSAKTKNQSIDGVFVEASQTIRRNVLVLTTAAGETPAGQDFYLDFPTTLYTVQDYFKTWNIWLKQERRRLIPDDEIARLQQRQIKDFFRHLEELSDSDVGVEAVQKLDGTMHKEALRKLYSDHFEKISTTDLSKKLEALATPA